MPDNNRKTKAETLDDLFGLSSGSAFETPPGMEASEVIVEMPLDQIDDFKDHPYYVRKDHITMGIVKDIQETGYLETPGIVRPKGNGRYEMIAGHRRKFASMLAGRSTQPVIIRNMTDDEAIIAMVRSNTQREDVLPSEKAFAYKMRMEAETRQGKRPDITSRPLDGKLIETSARIGQESGDSGRQVQRFIRLTNLIPPILEMVDRKFMQLHELENTPPQNGQFSKEMGFRPAVEISYLTKKEQEALYQTMCSEDCTPSLSQALRMKQLSQRGELTMDKMFSILQEVKPNQRQTYHINQSRIASYIPKGYTVQQTEDYIVKAVEYYTRFRQRQQHVR